MMPDNQLTLGFISFLNCIPFFACLKDHGFDGKFVAGVPSELNRMLQAGELDVSPSSSFEYARNWRDYLVLPEHSIASQGAVKSVLLFSPCELHELDGQCIAMTGESATSINLLRILLLEFYQLEQVIDRVPDTTIETLIGQKKPALLIGDRALKMAQNLPEGVKVFDLGELWMQQTGLPFVFALWMIRKSALEQYSTQLSQLGSQLMASRQQVLAEPELFAAAAAQKTGITSATIVDYWNTIDYRLGAAHQQGLILFFQLCAKHKLLKQEPELHFLEH